MRVDLSGLPQFSVADLQPGLDAEETLITGAFSSLAGMRNDRGWLYRGANDSLFADVLDQPRAPGDSVRVRVFTADLTSDVQPGAVFPWLDGYFRQQGVTGWQPVDAPLPEGYVDADDHWLCLACHARYASQHDVSFAAEV